ncbi:hypothetical protein GCM10009799_21070 [Nocardiopsis rhodophaea]|uniref:YdbS-like PH domain-containing protein n=1 Tax=Nocardiopsis rhodophaea TaxID=280238 RepID=A0ABN2SY93_9ACTN
MEFAASDAKSQQSDGNAGSGEAPEPDGGAPRFAAPGADVPLPPEAEATLTDGSPSPGASSPSVNGTGPTRAAEDEAASAGSQAAGAASASATALSPVEAAFAAPGGTSWTRVAPVLAWYRRLLLLAVLLPGAVLGGAAIWAWSGWGWTIVWLALCVLGIALGWAAAEPARRSWGYAEGRTDFYLTYGVVVRQLVVVPYGRMQVVDVTSNLLEQALGIATLQVRTAATTAVTRIPGIPLADAVELRDRLTARSETFSTGL